MLAIATLVCLLPQGLEHILNKKIRELDDIEHILYSPQQQRRQCRNKESCANVHTLEADFDNLSSCSPQSVDRSGS